MPRSMGFMWLLAGFFTAAQGPMLSMLGIEPGTGTTDPVMVAFENLAHFYSIFSPWLVGGFCCMGLLCFILGGPSDSATPEAPKDKPKDKEFEVVRREIVASLQDRPVETGRAPLVVDKVVTWLPGGVKVTHTGKTHRFGRTRFKHSQYEGRRS